jgi:hypothetical protein
LILNHIYSPQLPAKNLKTIELPLPNRVVNIGQDAQWNVRSREIWKMQIKKYCKIQSPWPIGVPHVYFMVDRFYVA